MLQNRLQRPYSRATQCIEHSKVAGSPSSTHPAGFAHPNPYHPLSSGARRGAAERGRAHRHCLTFGLGSRQKKGCTCAAAYKICVGRIPATTRSAAASLFVPPTPVAVRLSLTRPVRSITARPIRPTPSGGPGIASAASALFPPARLRKARYRGEISLAVPGATARLPMTGSRFMGTCRRRTMPSARLRGGSLSSAGTPRGSL